MNLRNLDMLRGSLALIVLLGHARTLLWMSWNTWRQLEHSILAKVIAAGSAVFSIGSEMVLVFFALSGFFIHLRIALERARTGGATTFAAGDFLARRARRILPPYYSALLFTAILDGIGLHFFPKLYTASTGDALLDRMFAGTGFAWENLWPSLLAQPTLFGHTLSGNGAFWSIQREIFYYAVYPLFIMVWRRNRLAAYTIGIGMGCLANSMPTLLGCLTGAFCNYPIWLAGALLAEAMADRKQLSPSWSRSLGAASILLGVFAILKLAPPTHSLVILLLVTVLSVSAVVAVEALPGQVLLSLPGRALEWLGIRSYSIYVFHSPVIILGSAWIIHTYGNRPEHGWYALIGASAALTAGVVAFHLVERHFLITRRIERAPVC